MVLKAVIIVVSILAIILTSILVGAAIVVVQILENDPYIRNEIRQWLGAGEESVQDPQEEISSLPVTEEGKVVSIVGNSGCNSYKPNPIEIKVGDTVTWINNDSSLHTATSTSSNDSNLDSKVLRRGETFSFTFDKEGQYPYFCTLHPNMVGSVAVLPSSGLWVILSKVRSRRILIIIYNAIILLFENSQQRLQKYSLDGIDLKILNLLAANGRLSYRSIGLDVGLTTKSVKSRVDRMLATRVIERFLTRLNPSVIGYNLICAFALRKNKLTQELLNRINLIGDILYQFEVMGGVIGFDIAIKEGTEEKIELLLNSLRPALVGQIQSRNRKASYKLTQTDYTIMKQLIKNPRMEIGDIAAATAISPKTVRRRLDRMTRNHVLDFSVLPSPDAMKGYVIFFLDVKIKNRGHHQHVLQKIYEELHEHFMPLSSDMSNQEDSIGLLLGSEDAIGIELIRSKIESLDEVEQANAFLPIRLACPQEWIFKAIDKKIAQSSNERRETSENIASRMQ